MGNSSNAVRAGAAYIELFADDSQLIRGLGRARTELNHFGQAVNKIGTGLRTAGTWMLGLGTAIAAPLIAATKMFGDTGHELTAMSERTGVTVEALSELGYAAGQAGADLTTVEGSLRRMQNVIGKAHAGTKAASDALALLGLSADQLLTMKPDEQFTAIAEALAKIADPTLRASAAMGIFGRNGTALLPLFKDGARGVAALREEAQRLGLTISTGDAEAANAFHQALTRLWDMIKRAAFAVGSVLAPALQDVVGYLIDNIKAATDWIKANSTLVILALKVAAAFAAAGAGLLAAGWIISTIGGIFTGLASAISIVTTLLPMIAAAIAFLVTPAGLIIAAVTILGAALVALGGYALYASGALGAAWDWIMAKTQVLRDDFAEAFGAMFALLKDGDWSGAAQVLWLTLKMEWARGIAWLKDLWIGWKTWFLDIASDAWNGIVLGWNLMIEALRHPWETFTAALAADWIAIRKLIGTITPEEANAEIAAWAKAHPRTAQLGQEAAVAAAGDRARHASDADRERASSAQDFTDARKEWQAAVDAANAAKDTGKRTALADKGQAYTPPQAALDQTHYKLGIAGGFNAAAAWGMVGVGGIDRVIKATEATAKNTQEIADSMTDGDATYD